MAIPGSIMALKLIVCMAIFQLSSSLPAPDPVPIQDPNGRIDGKTVVKDSMLKEWSRALNQIANEIGGHIPIHINQDGNEILGNTSINRYQSQNQIGGSNKEFDKQMLSTPTKTEENQMLSTQTTIQYKQMLSTPTKTEDKQMLTNQTTLEGKQMLSTPTKTEDKQMLSTPSKTEDKQMLSTPTKREAVCDPQCINGNCTAPNTCTCDTVEVNLYHTYDFGHSTAHVQGWEGPQCQNAVCDPQCVNGNCTAPNTCTCDPGWEGKQCQNAVCDHHCANGRCTSPNNCTCNHGWDGPQCENSLCIDELFKVPGSTNQDFRFFTDSKITWHASKALCEAEGLVLANPDDPVALRTFLVESCGDKLAWLGAKGVGDTVVWDRNGTTLSSSSSAWSPYQPSGYGGPSGKCLELLVTEGWMNQQPTKPYVMIKCTDKRYTLCELIK